MSNAKDNMTPDELADTTAKLGVARRLYETYEDKRCFPRVHLRCRGLVLFEDERYSVIVHNISPDGAQIRCDRETAGKLNPDGRRIEADHELQIELIANLPVEYGGGLLKTTCRMWYFSIVPDNEVAFGLRFENLQAETSEILTEFIRRAMEPSADDTGPS